jgi:hypothetical protein
VLLGALLGLIPSAAHAEFQVKPFAGITFGGNTTFVDLDDVSGSAKLNLGISALWLGEIVGIEGDVATTSGFFTGSGDGRLVLRSHAATVTGNVVVAMPRRIARYGLRPYAVAGFGMVHVGLFDRDLVIPFGETLAAWDFGGGATGFLNDYVGLNWDVRMFRTQAGREVAGFSFGPAHLTFWRATMGLAIRL